MTLPFLLSYFGKVVKIDVNELVVFEDKEVVFLGQSAETGGGVVIEIDDNIDMCLENKHIRAKHYCGQ